MRHPGLVYEETWVLAHSLCMRLRICKEAASPWSSQQLREDINIPIVLGSLTLEG